MKRYFFLTAIGFYAIVSNAQNVGIGTSNPLNKLHVAGGFRLDTLTGVNGAGLLRHDANGVVYGIKFSGNISDVLRGEKNGNKKLVIQGGDNLRYTITELTDEELILGADGAFIVFKRIR